MSYTDGQKFSENLAILDGESICVQEENFCDCLTAE